LSMLGSAFIISEVLGNRKKRTKVYHRLLLGISTVDFVTSFGFALSTLPIPYDSGVYGARGNEKTCTAQGFILQFVITSPCYNLILAYYFMLVIRYHKTENKLRKIEPLLHVIPLLVGSITSFLSLGLELYMNANLWCWIKPEPEIYRMALFIIPNWTFFLIMVFFYFLTYKKVADLEKRVARYSFPKPSLEEKKRKASVSKSLKQKRKVAHSVKIAHQAYCYFAAFLLSWTPTTILRIYQMVTGETPYPLILIVSICLPLQGASNYIVYIRPRYLQYKKDHPDQNILVNILTPIFGSRLCTSQENKAKTFETADNANSIGNPADINDLEDAENNEDDNNNDEIEVNKVKETVTNIEERNENIGDKVNEV